MIERNLSEMEEYSPDKLLRTRATETRSAS